jgi:PAT family beta-lactamase induction signal transducer AmpG
MMAAMRFGPDLLASRPGRLTAFFLLYIAEGIPWGFIASAVVTQLRRSGLQPNEVALFTAAL